MAPFCDFQGFISQPQATFTTQLHWQFYAYVLLFLRPFLVFGLSFSWKPYMRLKILTPFTQIFVNPGNEQKGVPVQDFLCVPTGLCDQLLPQILPCPFCLLFYTYPCSIQHTKLSPCRICSRMHCCYVHVCLVQVTTCCVSDVLMRLGACTFLLLSHLLGSKNKYQ